MIIAELYIILEYKIQLQGEIKTGGFNEIITGVAIAAPLNQGSVVGYLRGDTAQDVYAKYGFVKATQEETALKPIP